MLNFIRASERYRNTVTKIPGHDWSQLYRVDSVGPEGRFLCFKEGQEGTPMLVSPPYAGHRSTGVDLARGRSLVGEMCEEFDRVYSWDWSSADHERRNDGISAYVERMDRDIEKIGEPVALVGVCQGGWQSAMYASLHPEKVKLLVTVAAPIDFAAPGGLNVYYKNLPYSFYAGLVKMGGGVMDGQYALMGYRMMHATARFVGDPMDLFWKMYRGQEGDIVKQLNFISWYENAVQRLPGTYYLEVIKMFQQNKLIKGRMKIGDRNIDLSNITCPVIVVTGGKDDITGREQANALGKYVGSNRVRYYEIPKVGHFGSFSGTASMKHWRSSIFAMMREDLCEE